MTTWNDLTAAASDLADAVRARFEAHGLAILATSRRDGSPRVSGLEPLFALGELWFGMMPGSLKSLDLQRDPWFALHSATIDKQVAEGDAKISGRAVAVVDDASIEAFRNAFAAAAGAPPPPGPIDLYRVAVGSVSLLTLNPAGGHLDIEVWTASQGLRLLEVS